MYERFFKRFLDIIISIIGLVVFLIPMIIIGVLVKIESKGPAIFCQQRLGKNKKIFTMYKFRSMQVNDYSDAVITSDENDCRITKVGRIIRKASLDELPQLLNILMGQMSIIGPRPMLISEYNEYITYISNVEPRLTVRPGLFCTVDIEFRAEATVQMQMDFDEKYVNAISLIGDIKCFFGVFSTVLSHKNVYSVHK